MKFIVFFSHSYFHLLSLLFSIIAIFGRRQSDWRGSTKYETFAEHKLVESVHNTRTHTHTNTIKIAQHTRKNVTTSIVLNGTLIAIVCSQIHGGYGCQDTQILGVHIHKYIN